MPDQPRPQAHDVVAARPNTTMRPGRRDLRGNRANMLIARSDGKPPADKAPTARSQARVAQAGRREQMQNGHEIKADTERILVAEKFSMIITSQWVSERAHDAQELFVKHAIIIL